MKRRTFLSLSLGGLAAACTGTELDPSASVEPAGARPTLDRLVFSGQTLNLPTLSAHGERLVPTSSGTLVSLDTSAHHVSELDAGGEALWTSAEQGASAGQLNSPTDAVELAGTRFVVDRGNHRVAMFTESGSWDGSFGADTFNLPFGIASDSEETLWVTDTMNSRVVRMSLDGRLLWTSPAADFSLSTFNGPRGISIDRAGYVHVADAGWGHVVVLDPQGRRSTAYGASDGMLSPRGVAADAQGRIYVADPAAMRVFVYADGRLETTWTPQAAGLEFASPTAVSIVGDSLIVTLA